MSGSEYSKSPVAEAFSFSLAIMSLNADCIPSSISSPNSIEKLYVDVIVLGIWTSTVSPSEFVKVHAAGPLHPDSVL